MEISRLTEVKGKYKNKLLNEKGVWGVGEGADEIIVYVQEGYHPAIPIRLDGVPVKVIYGDRPRALVKTV